MTPDNCLQICANVYQPGLRARDVITIASLAMNLLVAVGGAFLILTVIRSTKR